MPKLKMSVEEKADLLLRVLELYNSGHDEEADELFKKNIPAEKWMERALGRDYLEENGYDTSKL